MPDRKDWPRVSTGAVVAAIAAVLLVTACEADRSLRPSNTPDGAAITTAPSAERCSAECVLMADARPFHAARYRSDSAGASIDIGSVTLHGGVSDGVQLTLAIDSSRLAAVGSDVRLITIANNTEHAVSLAQLRAGVTVYQLSATDTVTLHFVLTRRVVDDDVGAIRLTMRTNAQVDAARTPWVRRIPVRASGLALDETGGTSCTLTQPTGTCGTMTYTIAPFAVGSAFGTFQSDPGTGQSHDITITFSQPVSSVTTTIQDPTFAGNTITAFDASGAVVGSDAFAFNGTPGINNPDTRTITGSISRVLLVAAQGDYVAYDMTVTLGAQSVNVSCTAAPVRGTTVRCTTTLLIPQAYTIVRRKAKGTGYTIEDATSIAHAAGDADVWEGDAVASSDVIVTVQVTNGGATTQLKNSTPAHFDVQSRGWPDWQLTTLAARLVALVPGKMAPYAVPGTDLGLFQIDLPDATTIPLSRPTTGPNQNVAYIKDPISVTDYEVGIYPGLVPTPPGVTPGSPGYTRWNEWYDDQNGSGSGTCHGADVAQLLANVDRHEGTTQASDSHFGVANQQFASLHPQNTIEALYSQKSDAEVAKLIETEYKNFFNKGAYRNAQKSFDGTDTPKVFNTGIFCTFDFNDRDS